MTETVVRVETLAEWKSVLYVWVEHGYKWQSGDKEYHGEYFKDGERYLLLDKDNNILIPTLGKHEPVSYEEFMTQQEKTMTKETYYVTQEQLDSIEELKALPAPLVAIMNKRYGFDKLYNELPLSDNEWLRYLGGDDTIEFKVKEQLYRLWRDECNSNFVYMKINNFGTPGWTTNRLKAFIAPREEIEKWKTPAWEIEEVK